MQSRRERLSRRAPSEQPAAPAAPETTVGETAEREIVVETTTVRAVFTNRGARLLHWTMKAFRNDEGTALDLVPRRRAARMPSNRSRSSSTTQPCRRG